MNIFSSTTWRLRKNSWTASEKNWPHNTTLAFSEGLNVAAALAKQAQLTWKVEMSFPPFIIIDKRVHFFRLLRFDFFQEAEAFVKQLLQRLCDW